MTSPNASQQNNSNAEAEAEALPSNTETLSGASALPKAYVPSDAEAAAISKWDSSKAWHTTNEAVASHNGTAASAYSIVMPPPNVTAALHLGHALNGTLQDVLTRYRRMKGDLTLWFPGTDHAGIATQTVVEKRLLSQGVKRLEMGREAFVDKTQEWKDEYEQIILDQFKSIGASCDWDRVRFTMDPVCSKAVRQAFFQLFDDGLIYRGKRLVNWDPATQTALADDEVEMEEIDGHMWYLKYPLEDGSGHVTVATTRPETMFGDTAVAVNPNNPKTASFIGKTVILPIVGRKIPVIADDYVVIGDPESSDTKARYSSGFLKVTPAHDPNDYDIGMRHDLEVINTFGPDASLSDQYGWTDISELAKQFLGLERDALRKAVVEWFSENDLVDSIVEYSHSVGHSYRSHQRIEPWLSDQWYVKVTDDRLRGTAQRAVVADQIAEMAEGIADRSDQTGDGEMRFYPERYARTYAAWHENIRDWCISRQLWWGHRIPVFSRTSQLEDASAEIVEALTNSGSDTPAKLASRFSEMGASHMVRYVTSTEIEEMVCLPAIEAGEEQALGEELTSAGFTQDPDVLDTWFSSALWPLSTMGWPDKSGDTAGLLQAFNPTSVLTTAREIITLWVSRMVMFNRYFNNGELPFRDVFIHAMIQDGHGQKMSKSLGNGVDPRDIIHTHGADAMRFTLIEMTTETQDLRMPVDLVCPHTGEEFTPQYFTTPAGHQVTKPIQECPSNPNLKMLTVYGALTTGETPTDVLPMAINTSKKFNLGRNFANKVWNANRFALGRLDGIDNTGHIVDLENTAFINRWIMTRLAQSLTAFDNAISKYRFNEVAKTLYDFIWRDVCDRYLEVIKPSVGNDRDTQVVLGTVIDASLRMLHPVCPFITESLWAASQNANTGEVKGFALAKSDLAMSASWPSFDEATQALLEGPKAAELLQRFERIDQLGGAVRGVRAKQQVKPRQKITIHAAQPTLELINSCEGTLQALAGIDTVLDTADIPEAASALVFEAETSYLTNMVDAKDAEAERERLKKRLVDLAKRIGGLKGRLSNEGYVNGAPAHLVQQTRDELSAAEADLQATEAALAAL